MNSSHPGMTFVDLRRGQAFVVAVVVLDKCVDHGGLDPRYGTARGLPARCNGLVNTIGNAPSDSVASSGGSGRLDASPCRSTAGRCAPCVVHFPTIPSRHGGRAGSTMGRQPQNRTRRHTVGETAEDMSCVVMWFRRDLRLSDHPALVAAAATGRPVVPLFVIDPTFSRAGAPRRAYMREALREPRPIDGRSVGVPIRRPSDRRPAIHRRSRCDFGVRHSRLRPVRASTATQLSPNDCAPMTVD